VIPFGFVFVNRAHLTGLNVIGLKRLGFDKHQVGRLHVAFGLLFRDEGRFKERLEQARVQFGTDPLIAKVLEFIDAPSHRGLLRAE
jgi:UDP-N-acetylglucosamine acyltransferase